MPSPGLLKNSSEGRNLLKIHHLGRSIVLKQGLKSATFWDTIFFSSSDPPIALPAALNVTRLTVGA